MKMIILMEDSVGNASAAAEHGLSIYVETPKHVLLMDTGASDLTWRNAETLGIDITKVDTVIVSHGHYDHAGGLLGLAKHSPRAEIYMQRSALGPFYHGERYIGIDREIARLPHLHLLDGDLRLDEELYLFSGITGRRLWPSGNLLLSEQANGQLIQDQFRHEQCLVISAEGQQILLSGCAHNGILNILDRYRQVFHANPDVVISGFHMMKQGDYSDAEANDIRSTARELAKLPTVFYTGHCTGDAAFEIMKPIMGSQLHRIRSGDLI